MLLGGFYQAEFLEEGGEFVQGASDFVVRGEVEAGTGPWAAVGGVFAHHGFVGACSVVRPYLRGWEMKCAIDVGTGPGFAGMG